MSITIGEGLALYRAGRSLFSGVRQAFQNRGGGKQAQQIEAFRTALAQQLANKQAVSGAANLGGAAGAQTPNQQRIAATIAELERALGKVFSEHPMDLSRPAVLQLDTKGITVKDGHLDGARLEALFNDRPDLQRLVHRLDIALRSEPGVNPLLKQATTLTIGSNGISAALQSY